MQGSGNIEYDYSEVNIPSDLTEHFDMALPDLPRSLANMAYPVISCKEVEIQLKKVKCGMKYFNQVKGLTEYIT